MTINIKLALQRPSSTIDLSYQQRKKKKQELKQFSDVLELNDYFRTILRDMKKLDSY